MQAKNSDCEEYASSIIRFTVCIRKPIENETGIDTSTIKRNGRSKSPMASRSPSILQPKSNVKNQKQIQTDYKYCLFTTKEESNIILASDLPISGKLINSALISPSDVPIFNSSLQNKPLLITFDSVLNECASQEKFYNQNVRPLIQGLMLGHSATVICWGPAE